MNYKYSECIHQNENLNLKILELMIKRDLKPLVIFFGNRNRWLKRNYEKSINEDEDENQKKEKNKIINEKSLTIEEINKLKDHLEEKINNFVDNKLAENYFIFNKKVGNTYFIEYALTYFPYPYIIHQLMEHYITIIPNNQQKNNIMRNNLLNEKVKLNYIKNLHCLFLKDNNNNYNNGEYDQWNESLDNSLLNSGPIENQKENTKKMDNWLYRGRSMINPSNNLISEDDEEEEGEEEEEKGEEEFINISENKNNDEYINIFTKSNFLEIKQWQSEYDLIDDNKIAIPNNELDFKHCRSLDNIKNMKVNKNKSLLSIAIRNKLPVSVIEILLKFSVSTSVPTKNIRNANEVNDTLSSEEYTHNLIKKSRFHFNANYLIFSCKNDTRGNKNELVKILLKYNINPNSQDELGKTALMYAIENNDIVKVKMLLNYIYITNDLILGLIFFGRSRARIKNKELARYVEICGGKVDINIKDNNKKNAFDYACIYKNEAIIKLLLIYTINRNKLRKKFNNYNYSNINIRNSSYLRGCSYSSFNLRSSSYFKNGSYINCNSNLKGSYNCYSNNYNISSKNLKEGISTCSRDCLNGSNGDVYNSNYKGLHRNNSITNKSVYELSKSTNLSSLNISPEKIKFGETDKVNYYSSNNLICRSNTNINGNENNLFFPISYEAINKLAILSLYRNYTEILKILLENGLNPNITDENGNTPLHLLLKINILSEEFFSDENSTYDYKSNEIDNENNLLTEKINYYDTYINRIEEHDGDFSKSNNEENDNLSRVGINENENLLKMDNTDMVITERINSSNSNMSSILPKTFLNKLKKLLKDKMNKEMILYLAIWNENINIVNNKLNEWSNMNNFTFDLDIALILSVLKNNKKIEALLLNKANEKLIEQKNKKWLVLHYLCSIKVYKEKIIDFLLEHKVNLNNRNSKGKLPLQIAVKYNNFPMVELLIKNNADIPKNQSDDEPFFISVCKTNNIEMVNYIINNVKTIDIYEKDEYDNNAFMIVCKYGYTEIAKKLYTYSYNINDEDIYGNTALIIACQNGHLDIIKLLVNENVNIDSSLDISLSSITNMNNYEDINENENNLNNLGHFNLMNISLSDSSVNNRNNYNDNSNFNRDISSQENTSCSGIKINKKNNRGMTAFVMLCQHGDLESVKYLSQYIGDINEKCHDGSTGLMVACYNNNENIIQYLLDHGADPNEKDSYGNNSLIYACQMGNFNVVKLLLENTKDIDVNETNRNKNTALMYACQHGYENIVKILLEYHADLNIKDMTENTALIYSIRNDFQDISVLLIENGADTNCIESENKSTALMIACQTKQHKVVKALLDHKAEINIQNKFYYCPLLTAVENNDEELVKILLQYNALINSYDTYGNNPLMLACTIGNKNIVELLLNNYSTLDINEKNSLNNTALHNACESGNIEIVSLLLDHHATINNINNSGLTELAIAGQNNHVEIVKLLLKQNAVISIENFLKINLKGYYKVQQLIVDSNAIL